MSSRNRVFAEGLVSAAEVPTEPSQRGTRLGMGVFAGRTNRLAELASGTVVNRVHELVDPARCRMWAGHNRDYAALSEDRCRDLIESMKAQSRQEVPALVRRLRDDPDHDFEVICGARRHWSVSWLRAHNYSDFRFLVEVRELTDEEAFRLSDLENRARADISDLERARDYVKALDRHYEGRQNVMAERLKVTASWLSRYLDLARLPEPVMAAFADPHDLGIRHVTLIKPLLKPAERQARVLAEAKRITASRAQGEPGSASVVEVIRCLAAAAKDAPKKSGAPKRSGSRTTTISGPTGKPMLRMELLGRSGLAITLVSRSEGSRADIDAALAAILDEHWS